MSVTIIIPSVSEPTLEQVVSSVKTEIPDGQIILVGFGESKNIAEKFEVQFVDTKQKTPKPIGINRAVKEAVFDRIIVIDADTVPKHGWGQNMLKAFEEGKRVFSGSFDISVGNFWMKVYNLSWVHDYLADNPPQRKKSLPAGNLGFTKEAYQIGGRWDESQLRSEDFEWSIRLAQKGIDLWFVPNATVTHIPTSRNTYSKVMKSWRKDAYYNWLVRIKYKEYLHTPKILSQPILILLLSPLLALAPTIRIIKTSPKNFLRYIHLIPFVYLTKVYWCLGVFESSKRKNNSITLE